MAMLARTLRTTVASAEEASQLLDGEHSFSHLVSIGDSDSEMTPPFYARFQGEKLRLLFDDINQPTGWASIRAGYIPPSMSDVRNLVNFFRRVLETRDPNVLAHCGQGISRSGAAALILHFMFLRGRSLCDWIEAARNVFRDHPWVDPNRTMLMLADCVLDSGDCLVRAEGWLLSLKRNERGEFYSG
jgi:predicted protein tyrosine phosphatase